MCEKITYSCPSVRGKRLLVLGSKPIIADIVRKAQSMGVTVGVTDYIPYAKAEGKKVADESYDISLSDIQGVTNLIREKKYDGVLTGFTDSYLKYYLEICRASNVPCYGSEHSFAIATSKTQFKAACRASGCLTIPGSVACTFKDARTIIQSLDYPVILKPSDNSGSRGVARCNSEEQLKASYDYAVSFSSSGEVIVEKFMDCDSIGVSYFIVNGEAYLTSVCDRSECSSKSGKSWMAGSLTYPSKYTKRYVAEADKAARRLLRVNGFSSGMISLMAFVDDKGFYFCEMCFRPSGGHHYIFIKDQTGNDELASLIEYALTGSNYSFDPQKATPFFQEQCAMGKILGITGRKLHSVRGLDIVRQDNRMLAINCPLELGDEVGTEATTAQILATVWYKVKGNQSRKSTFFDIVRPIDFLDEKGLTIVDSYLS